MLIHKRSVYFFKTKLKNKFKIFKNLNFQPFYSMNGKKI